VDPEHGVSVWWLTSWETRSLGRNPCGNNMLLSKPHWTGASHVCALTAAALGRDSRTRPPDLVG
jgi:hypothetical protein